MPERLLHISPGQYQPMPWGGNLCYALLGLVFLYFSIPRATLTTIPHNHKVSGIKKYLVPI
jgi:hypothetical protein